MFRFFRLTLVLGGVVWVACDRVAEAGLFFHHDKGTPPPGRPRYFENTHARAGFPLCVSPHAKPAITPEFVGYYVGGGAAHGGCPRRAEDGTWGLDYRGHWIPRHVMLGWTHGGLYQGGTGSYDPDGIPVPDVINLTVSKIREH